MAPLKSNDPPFYHPLPPSPDHPRNYVVLPIYIPATPHRRCPGRIRNAVVFLLLALAVFFLYPSNPDLTISRLRLDRIHVQTSPFIAIDVTLGLTVKIRNVDLYSLDYRSLSVSIGYRGKQLGFVTSDGGHVKARGSSYVDATLELDGVEVIADVILLLEDLARGSVPFDTVTEVRGRLGVFFFQLPLKAKVSCEVNVNIRNQTIIRQNCYPE